MLGGKGEWGAYLMPIPPINIHFSSACCWPSVSIIHPSAPAPALQWCICSRPLSIQHMAMTTPAHTAIHVMNMAPGSIMHSGRAAAIMAISMHARAVCITMSPMSAHNICRGCVSMAQQSEGIVCSIWAISWRSMAITGICERGVVPQAPSQRAGM